MRIIVIAAIALLPVPTLACSFDTECNPGSKCLKRSGQLEGVCAGGMFPGRPTQNDQQARNRDPYQWNNRTEGQQCSFNTECGAGSMCLKEAGRLYGVCIRK